MVLCEQEGWPSFLEDPDKTWRALTAPGVITIVATSGERVLGFAQLQTDGAIQAHLSNIAVDRNQRREGIGRRLIEEAFAQSNAKRIDLVSTEGAHSFYESFAHNRIPGYRIYPQYERDEATGLPR
jgi:ribosomal protein S18 acetylase RimI-like enzyme